MQKSNLFATTIRPNTGRQNHTPPLHFWTQETRREPTVVAHHYPSSLSQAGPRVRSLRLYEFAATVIESAQSFSYSRLQVE